MDATTHTSSQASTSAPQSKMEALIQKAIGNLHGLEGSRNDPKYDELLGACHGVVLLSGAEVAFLFSGMVATGIVMRHDLSKGSWSPPSAIALAGVGAGFVAGIETKQITIFLMEPKTMRAFCAEGQIRLGVQSSLAAGDVLGDEIDLTVHAANRGGMGFTSAIVHNNGAFVGVSLEGSIVAPRSAVNHQFYGDKVQPKKILYGEVTVPENSSVAELYEKLHDIASQAATTRARNSSTGHYKDTIANPFLHKKHVNQMPKHRDPFNVESTTDPSAVLSCWLVIDDSSSMISILN